MWPTKASRLRRAYSIWDNATAYTAKTTEAIKLTVLQDSSAELIRILDLCHRVEQVLTIIHSFKKFRRF